MANAATIFALSSGAPPAAIGVVRVSGPGAAAALVALYGKLPEPRRATLGWLRDPADGEQLDRALLLWLPGPRTATGEDLAELHLHGGRAVTAAVLAALARMPGLRSAEPGEFTRRAFANGVIDLAQAEGLADLLAAETEAQRRSAQALAGGALSRRVEAWRREVLDLSARVEAMIDHSDEEDVTGEDPGDVAEAAMVVVAEMETMLRRPPAERLRDGVRVVIAGPPNAGKSTLLNAIAGREAAIVSPIAGTTRDLIEVPLAIEGRPFLIVDTAGLREGEEEIEREGIGRAERAIAAGDVLLWLGEASTAPSHPARIVVQARADLPGRARVAPGADLACSALTGAGLDELVGIIAAVSERLLPPAGDMALHQRHRDALRGCVASLTDTGSADLLIVAEALRGARSLLDRIVGRVGTEEMLDALFARFCLGK